MSSKSYKVVYRVPGLDDDRILSIFGDLAQPEFRTHLRYLAERLRGEVLEETVVPIGLDD